MFGKHILVPPTKDQLDGRAFENGKRKWLDCDSASEEELVTFGSGQSHSRSICDSGTLSASYNFEPANTSLFICPRCVSQDAKMHRERRTKQTYA